MKSLFKFGHKLFKILQWRCYAKQRSNGKMIERARRGIDRNTLVTPYACPIYKQADGEHYGNMVYTEIHGQRFV
ncbi:hypothetical protein Mgra_00010308 [Meloidogyne graminicola]|uniref:Uncharacterized protein n=1 Tax=Meloidogyne graminicola TaxID=189291 RepID=A0A8S9ZCZ0_9BILA|nr:hypothetical protein Mgra_00010308 [Meloidogyne graminicola]